MRRSTRTSIAGGAGLALALLAATPAVGHVEPELSTVPARSVATVDFTVEHGCEGSPTVKMEFQVPDGITDAQPAEKIGWTGALVDGVVTYTGGSLPADQEDTFPVRFTVPDQVQAVLVFPMIQTCETGSIDWIQTEVEAERPAPRVIVGEPDPNATPSSAPTTAAPTTTTTLSTTVPSTTDSNASEAEDIDGQTAFPAITTPPTTGASPSDRNSGGAGALPWAVGAVGTIGVVGLGSLLLVRRRAHPDGAGGPSASDRSEP